MTPMLKLREKATMLGIEHIMELDCTALIRVIQIRESHQPCFGSQWCNPCQREECPWKVDCDAQPFGN